MEEKTVQLAKCQNLIRENDSERRYLAPEYVDGGQITHKVDVYAFGVVLLELMTGHRINQLQNAKGKHFLTDWFHPLAILDTDQLLDPSLSSHQSPEFLHQLNAMCLAASLCLRQDPESRPLMSKVHPTSPFFIVKTFLIRWRG